MIYAQDEGLEAVVLYAVHIGSAKGVVPWIRRLVGIKADNHGCTNKYLDRHLKLHWTRFAPIPTAFDL